ncbi:MAG: cytochrome b [Burkholderiaceae bacterium]
MSTRYSFVARGLHWLMAVLILGLFVLGVTMHELPFSPRKLQLYSWHKWAGVTVFVLVWLRLAWRITHPPPPLPESMSPRARFLAHAGHWSLYALMVVIPLSGWLMSSAKGVQTVWFGVVPLPDLLAKSKPAGDLLEEVHERLNQLFMLAVLGHFVAALWHQFVIKDDLMRRMR